MRQLEEDHRTTCAERDELLMSLESARCETEKYRGSILRYNLPSSLTLSELCSPLTNFDWGYFKAS